jgi:RNA polymerase sigma factor (sigma-70 family)
MQGNGSGHGQLVVQWKAHVARAFESQAARIAAVLSRTYGRTLAEDAVQEAFMRAMSWTHREGRLESLMNIGFMTRCASRVAIRHIRTERRRTQRERRWCEDAWWSRASDTAPAQQAERKERCELAVKVLDELPSWQRPVVQMMVVDGRRHRDVARITGVRTTTQANWRHDYVTELRHRLDRQG